VKIGSRKRRPFWCDGLWRRRLCGRRRRGRRSPSRSDGIRRRCGHLGGFNRFRRRLRSRRWRL